jgi:hypothetical protein
MCFLGKAELGKLASDDPVDVALGQFEVARMGPFDRLDRIRAQQDNLCVGILTMFRLGPVVGVECGLVVSTEVKPPERPIRFPIWRGLAAEGWSGSTAG